MVDGLETFQVVNSIKLHFSQKGYSVAKYGYNKRTFNYSAFEKRNDKYIYTKLGKNISNPDHLKNLASINMFYNPQLWVGDMLEDKARDRYLRFKSYKQSMMHYAIEDIKYMISEYGSFMECLKSGGIINEISTEKVHPATFCLLGRLNNIADIVTKHYGNNIIWETLKLRLEKFNSFISVPDLYFYKDLKYNCRMLVENKSN